MAFSWFDARDATRVAVALADQFAPRSSSEDAGHELPELLHGADLEIRSLRLNFYKKAKFANAFKWRLLENGVGADRADELTQRLVLHLSMNTVGPQPSNDLESPVTNPAPPRDGKSLMSDGNKRIAEGAYIEAIARYQELLEFEPRNATAHSNLGAALCKVGRYREAEGHFRKAIKSKPDFADAYSNLGNVLRWSGQITESEAFLRRALKLNPRLVDARINLGLTLAFQNRGKEAGSQLQKALKLAPRSAEALCGLAFVAKTEGRFDDARDFFQRALKVNPNNSGAWAAQVGLRKMTSADSAWLHGAEEVAKGSLSPLDEAELRFAMGKYCDDVGNFKQAFENYKRANDLLKPIAQPYDRESHRTFIEDLTRLYTRETVARQVPGRSDSRKPVLVIGMPRSGTSLTEQIIASHPLAAGAGELEFWSDAVRAHSEAIRNRRIETQTITKLAADYLHLLESYSSHALRIVDKAPINSDYLGLIHSVFPNARFVYMRRDPIDTCLSCYFQQFSLGMGFTMDLSDLAHYYLEHRVLMDHWRAILPPGTILEVPYADLVADHEGWARRIVEFLDLEWDERCLNFQETNRSVVTSSFWQVRQKVYQSSVMRWRSYEKFIGPLLELKNIDA